MEGKGLTSESYFSFLLGDSLFSIPVVSVREVINFSTLTPVPNSLPYLRGVMNIRGSVVTIVDLRRLFGFVSSPDLQGTSVIVTEVKRSDGSILVIGLIADSADVVSRLKFVPFDMLEPSAMTEHKEFVQAVARRGDKFILVLDPAKILDSIEADISVPVK